MRKFMRIGLLIVILSLVATMAYADWKIVQVEKVLPDGSENKSVMWFGKDMLRADNPKMQSSVIMNFDKDSMYMLQHQPKIYLEMKISVVTQQMQEMMKMMKKDAKKDEIDVVETKDKKTISGYKCTKMVMKRSGTPFGSVWVTKDINDKSVIDIYDKFFEMAGPKGPDQPKGLAAMQKALKVGFPITIEQTMDDGKSMVSDVISAEKIDSDNSRFEPPKDYQKVTPQQLMGGMQGAPGPAGPPAGGQVPPPPAMPQPPAPKGK